MLMVREKSLVIYVRIVFNRVEIYDPNYYYVLSSLNTKTVIL